MATVLLYPTSITNNGLVSSGSYTSVDNDPTTGQPDGDQIDTLVDEQTGTYDLGFTMPVDLTTRAQINSITLRAYGGLQSTSDDTVTYTISLFDTGNNAFTNTLNWTRSGDGNTLSLKTATPTGASTLPSYVRIDQTAYSKNKGSDGLYFRLHAVQLEINYSGLYNEDISLANSSVISNNTFNNIFNAQNAVSFTFGVNPEVPTYLSETAFASTIVNEDAVGVNWVNPAYANDKFTDRAASASLSVSETLSDYIVYKDFNFSAIPSGATLTGLKVYILADNLINENTLYVTLRDNGTTLDQRSIVLDYPNYVVSGGNPDSWDGGLPTINIDTLEIAMITQGSGSADTTALYDVYIEVFYTEESVSAEGPLAPSSYTANVTGGTVNWSNPQNILIPELSSSTSASSINIAYTKYLTVYDLGFNIPAQASITGIETIVSFSTTVSGGTMYIHTSEDGVVSSANTFKSYSAGTYLDYFGGSTTLFDGGWTPERINSSTFGIATNFRINTNSYIYLYSIWVKVYYEYPFAPGLVFTATRAANATSSFSKGASSSFDETLNANTVLNLVSNYLSTFVGDTPSAVKLGELALSLLNTVNVDNIAILLNSLELTNSNTLNISANAIFDKVLELLYNGSITENLTSLFNEVISLQNNNDISTDSVLKILGTLSLAYSNNILTVEQVAYLGALVLAKAITQAEASSLIIGVLAEFNKNITKTDSVSLTALAISSFSNSLSISDASNLVLTAITELSKSLTITSLSELLANTLIALSESFTIDEIASLLISVSTELSKNYTIEETTNLITSVVAALSKTLSIEDTSYLILTAFLNILSNNELNIASSFIGNVAVALSNTLTIEAVAQLFGTLFGSIALNTNVTIQHATEALLNVLIQLSTSLNISELSQVIYSVILNLTKIKSTSYSATLVTEVITNLSKSLTIADTSNLITNVITALSKILSVEDTATLVTNIIIALSKTLNVEDIAALITNAVTALSKTLSVEDTAALLALVAIQLGSSLDVDSYTVFIGNIILGLSSSYDIQILSDILGSFVGLLSFNTSISIEYQTQAILHILVELSNNITLAELASVLSNVAINIDLTKSTTNTSYLLTATIVELSKTLNVSSTTYLITSVYVELLKAYNINYTSSLIAEALLALNNSYGINFVEEVLGQLFETLSLNTQLSIETISILIANVLLNLNSTLVQTVTGILPYVIYRESIDLNITIDTNTLATLNIIEALALNVETSILEDFEKILSATLNLSTDTDIINIATLNLIGELELTSDVYQELDALGVFTSNIDIVSLLGLTVLKNALLRANISLNNIIIIETDRGFDLLIEVSDSRKILVHLDTREYCISTEDRRLIISEEVRSLSVDREDRTIIVYYQQR